MNCSVQRFFKTGLVHFMAYPEAVSDQDDIEKSIRHVLEDPYFEVIELTHIQDAVVRRRISEMACQAGVEITYGAQPQLMRNHENLCSLDETLRRKSVARVKACIDEALELGASAVAVLAGPYDKAQKKEHYERLLDSSRELCQYALNSGGMGFNLEVFDAEIEKCSLIGHADLAGRYAQQMHSEFDNFGIMADLSHILQLNESFDESLGAVSCCLRHVHLANTVLLPNAPSYGDQHPRFGFPNSLVDVRDVYTFLKALFRVGYLAPNKRPILSFEVKPYQGESSDMIIAGAKRLLNQALIMLEEDGVNVDC